MRAIARIALLTAAVLALPGIAAPAGQAPAPIPAPGTLAEAGGVKITAEAVEARLQRSLAFRHVRHRKELRQMVDGAIEQRIADAVLAAEAERAGVTRRPRYLAARRILEDMALADEYVRARYRERFAPTEEELKAHYPAEWRTMRARAIFFPTREDAEAARPEIAANKDRWGEMYAKHSVMQTSKEGDLGMFFRGKSSYFGEQDDSYLFTLKPGEISRVVDIEVGAAIVRVEEIRALGPEEIEQISADVRRKVGADKMNRHVNAVTAAVPFEMLDGELRRAISDELAFRRKDRAVARLDGMELTFYDLLNTIKKPPEAYLTTINVDNVTTQYEAYLDQARTARALASEARAEGFEGKGGGFDDTVIRTRVLGMDIFKDVSLEESEVRKFYDDNRKAYFKEEYLVLRRIQVEDESQARMIYESVSRGEQGFEKAAALFSKDRRERITGGDMGAVDRKDLPKEAQEAIKGLAPGKVAPPVKVDDMWHVYTVVGLEKDYTIPYEKVRWEVGKQLLRAKQQPKLRAYVDRLRAETKAVRHEANIEKFVEGLARKKKLL